MVVDVASLARVGRLLFRRARIVVVEDAGERGVVVGYADDGAPVLWPLPSRQAASHVLIVAGSGAGKTIMLARALVLELLACEALGEPIALLVVDPKGDLVAAILIALAALAPHRLRDVVVLDPFLSGGGFPLNLNRFPLHDTPLAIHALRVAQLASAVSTATGEARHLGTGPRQVELLQRTLHGALSVPDGDVLLAVEAMLVRQGFKKLAALAADPRAQEILANTYASPDLLASCVSRLRIVFGASEGIERMVSAPGCVDFLELTQPGRICLGDFGRPVGGLPPLREFFANLTARLPIDLLLGRASPSNEHHVRIVVDEAASVTALADRAEELLATGRSRALSLFQVIQSPIQMHEVDPAWLRLSLGNTSTVFVGRLAAEDAERLSRGQAPGRGIDESIGAIRGRIAAAVTSMEDREFFALRPGSRVRFRTADVDLAAWQRAADEHRHEIEAAKHRLALPADLPPRRTLEQRYAELEPPRRGRRATTRPAQTPADESAAPAQPRRPRSRWG